MAALLFIWTLLALAFIDIDTQLLPDDLTLPLLWLGLLFNLGDTFTDLSSAVIGAMAGYLVLWAVYWLFRLATRPLSPQESAAAWDDDAALSRLDRLDFNRGASLSDAKLPPLHPRKPR